MTGIILLMLTLSLVHVLAHNRNYASEISSARSYNFFKQCCIDGHYRCTGQGQEKLKPCFLPKENLCDGVSQCPMGDDEWNCSNFCQCQPPNVSNARMLKTPKKISPIDSAVRYECLEGYTHAPGSDSVICQEDGTWSPAPTCVRVCQGQPPNVSNARMLKTPKKISPIDSAVRYECLEGYTHAPGSDSVICQEDGTWSPAPTCVRVCRQEDAVVDNGVAIAGAGPFVAGSVIQFGCNAGFISAVCNGSNVLVCQPDGSWTRRGGCMPESPLACIGDDPCTTSVNVAGVEWRLCHGDGVDLCSPTRGRLELSKDGGVDWRGVCHHYWIYNNIGLHNLNVACRTLGFSHGSDFIDLLEGELPDIGVWIDWMMCTGAESSLLECQQDELNPDHVCYGGFIAVSCLNSCNAPSLFPTERADFGD